MDATAIAQALSALAEACARRRAGQAIRGDESAIRHYMENESCEKMLPYYERLWMSLAEDSDAADAVKAYGWPKQWPPARREVIDTYLDLTGFPRGRRRTQTQDRYYKVLDQAIDVPPEVLVAALGAAERQRAATHDLSRATFAADAARSLVGGIGFGGCALSGYRYLVVASPLAATTVALLIAVPYGGADRGEPVVLGRMVDRYWGRDEGPGDLPAPLPSVLPSALRPFAAIIPVLLAQAAIVRGLAEWRSEIEAHKFGKAERAHVAEQQQKRTIVERALDPLLSRLAWIEALSVLPPEVTPHLVTRPSPYTMYAWFGECQLAEGLAVALGQHAAAAAGPYAAAIRAESVVFDNDSANGNSLGASDKRRRAAAAGSTGRTPNRLEALVRRALARTPAAFAVDALPCTLWDDVGFDVWQATCDSTTLDRHPADRRYAPLAAVARAWGTEPDEGELERPQLLCGRLAHAAITRGVRQGERLAPDVSARTGRPTTLPGEREAIEAVCGDDQPTRPFERVDRASVDAAVGAAFRAAYRRSPDAGDAPLVAAVMGLVADANSPYGAQSYGRQLHTVDTQSALALLALRSGADLVAADLANAGSACAAITPTFALAP
ncbi:hypothetical protein psal_cds_1081 [Pandoravirus salinus]|uniref:Uncharacterized protein n=1 Tax=Pandoravirus salinus TaxID=1349410 RepID=S4W3P3_9VIRU|nr:hypothetical protein psal_cds_1081 [Pandoravirus salinus]AGO85297.1 hypothetical protein psal_cds_1081 [Pandoravirus salinus]